jgi:hypothetical protein
MTEKKCKYCAMIIPKEANICPHCRKKQGWSWLAKIAVGLFALLVLGSVMNSGKNSAGTASKLSPLEEARSRVKLDYEWGKTGFDSVMEATFSIDNQSKYTIKDITIKCTHLAKSGTAIDSNSRTIYDTVNARSRKVISKFNMGFIHSQAYSTGCAITDFKIN